jgi:hypothetical protein
MTTSAGTSRRSAAVAGPATPDPTAAVLYVCAARGRLMPDLAAERAEAEGHVFAQEHGLAIREVVTDEFGQPDPELRTGWQRVRALAAAGEVATVLTRWPAAIAPDSSIGSRHRETAWLMEHGVRVLYTWEPLR